MRDKVRKPAGWRDPLSLSFELHRRVLLVRLKRRQRRQAASAPASRSA